MLRYITVSWSKDAVALRANQGRRLRSWRREYRRTRYLRRYDRRHRPECLPGRRVVRRTDLHLGLVPTSELSALAGGCCHDGRTRRHQLRGERRSLREKVQVMIGHSDARYRAATLHDDMSRRYSRQQFSSQIGVPRQRMIEADYKPSESTHRRTLNRSDVNTSSAIRSEVQGDILLLVIRIAEWTDILAMRRRLLS